MVVTFVLAHGDGALGGTAREGERADVEDRGDETAAGVAAAYAGDVRVRVAVCEGHRTASGDAREAAGVRAGGGDGAGGRAAFEENAGAGDESGEQADVGVVAADGTLRGAVADRGGAVYLARERAAAFVSFDGDALQVNAVDRRAVDTAKEADSGSGRIAARRVVEREADDLVAVPVELAGERRT